MALRMLASGTVRLKVVTGNGGDGGGTGRTRGGATAGKVLTARAYLEPSQIKDLADLMPQLVEIMTNSNVPLQFLVQVELGDGQTAPSKEAASKVTRILSDVCDKLQLRWPL